MTSSVLTTVVLLGILVFFVILILMYNALIFKKNQIENMEGNINVILKKRYDLIPNFVRTLERYMQHEKEVFEKITELRTKAKNEKDFDNKIDIENELAPLMSKLFVNVENYPQLKADKNFIQFEKTLKDIEDELSAARRAYNQAITDYNNTLEMFPTNIMASFMHLKTKKTFDIPEQQKRNIEVFKQ
jgi:LemA protein